MLLGPPRSKLHQRLTRTALSETQSLQLPFLCPALLRIPIQTRKNTSRVGQTSESRQTISRPSLQKAQTSTLKKSRGLASAALETVKPHDDFTPFDSPSDQGFPHPGFESIFSLRGFDSNPSPLILKDGETTKMGRFKIKNGITGDLNEIHQTLHACLQVGRLERAAALVRRLNEIYLPEAPGLLAAHKDYLRELTLTVTRTKDMQTLEGLRRWFEVEIRQKGVPQDETTFALIIQACLQDSNEDRKERAIKRYYQLAQEGGFDAKTKELVPQLEAALRQSSHNAERHPVTVENSALEQPKEDSDKAPAELRAVVLKGLGLETVNRSLSSLYIPELGKLPATERQRRLEEDTVEAAIKRWKWENAQMQRLGVNSALSEKAPLGAMMWTWHEQLLPVIKEEQRLAAEAEEKDPSQRSAADKARLAWGPYLQLFKAEKASAAMIMATMTGLAMVEVSSGARIAFVLQEIVGALKAEASAEIERKNRPSRKWRKLSRKPSALEQRRSASPFGKYNLAGESNFREEIDWPKPVQFQLSAMLLSKLSKIALVEVLRRDSQGKPIQEYLPVFFHTFQYQSGKRVGVLRLNSVIVDKLSKAPVVSALAKNLPMLCEPRAWRNIREGGFLTQKTSVVREHRSDLYATAYIAAAGKNGDFAQVFEGLNVLGKTPWAVNRPVYDVIAQAWNSGAAIANIPPEKPSFPYPPEPPPSDDVRPRNRWNREVEKIDNRVNALRSERAFMNFQLEIARAFVNEIFYLPHNLDFRGRAYPMAPFFNHMGADHDRGLLLFAQGKELGVKGLWWLKVHLASVYGHDKASFQERISFTEGHLEEIRDSVTRPLEGSRWWLQAENPWQCLAACIELHRALQLPDPTKFVSHLPIHQDGSCNGLQHYAALGGDAIGARQVNLEPGDRPSDLYTAVSEMVKDKVRQDAADGNGMAQALDGHITRKVVKQTVMTNVYGVTVLGGARQVRKQLEERFPVLPSYGDQKLHLGLASRYIAKKIFSSLSNMFNGAHKIQRWFGQCGNRICESFSPAQLVSLESDIDGHKQKPGFKQVPQVCGRRKNLTSYVTPIVWTTPLKMPVVQPYRKSIGAQVRTELQMLSLNEADGTAPIDKSKQLAGFPPNFIHSLDGTHMFLTAIRCHELGLTFASVHDSFWTHACDVDTMNKTTRDAFVRMHSEDIITRLAAEFNARYRGHVRASYIASSHPAACLIRDWRVKYAAPRDGSIGRMLKPSNSQRNIPRLHELLLEGKRLRLLASDDPEERKEGEGMVTPASIVASISDQDTLTETETVPTPTISASEGRKRPGRPKQAKNDESEDADASAVGTVDRVEKDSEASGGATENADDRPETTRARKKAAPKEPHKVWFWTALTFPPVPEKGSFDITRLRNSPYFFS